MKKSLGILSGLFMVGCVAAFGSDADFVTYTNLSGTGLGGTLCVNGYTGTNTALTIPSEINGVSVTAVGIFLNSNISVVTVPASVLALYGLYGDPNLKTVYFMSNAPALPRMIHNIWDGFDGSHPTVCYMPSTTGFGEFINPDPGLTYTVVEWDARAAIQQTSTGACVTVTGNTNLSAVCVYACTNLANPNWTPITSTLSLASGPVTFTDTNPPPMRFYSVGWPQ